MGTRIGPRYRMAWQGNVGQMAAAGTLVTETCGSPHSHHRAVDVQALLKEGGPKVDLWDRRGTCLICGRPTWFMCSPGEGTVFRPMLTQ